MGPTPEGTLLRSPSTESFTDNSSISGQADDSTAAAYYTANITAACQAANAPRPLDLSTEEEVQLAKRRRSNRLSARRWRNRKKRNFTELRKKILELSKQQAELILEKSKLEQELKAELQQAMSCSARLPSLPMSRVYLPQPLGDFNMVFRSLLAGQSHGLPIPARPYAQGLGNCNFHAMGASRHKLPFPPSSSMAVPPTSNFLNSNEACAVSALLRGFISEV